MAKYIIDIPDGVPVSDELIPFDMCRPSWYSEAYEKGKAEAEDEVWSLAWKIFNMDMGEYNEIFDGKEYPSDYRGVKAKYEAWKKQNDEIHVGDEVEYECGGLNRFVVTGIYGRYAVGFKDEDDDIDVGDYCDIKYLRKTGRHFDEVEALLKKMRGKE